MSANAAVKAANAALEASQATEGPRPKSSGETVTVACKLPHGLMLRLFEMVDAPEPISGGGMKMVPRARQIGRAITVRGTALPFGKLPDFKIEGGYAMTEGVDADFWDQWLKANADSDVVRNGLIFASPRIGHAIGQAREQEEVRSGLEPLLLDRDPRAPKSLNPNVGNIEPGEKK